METLEGRLLMAASVTAQSTSGMTTIITRPDAMMVAPPILFLDRNANSILREDNNRRFDPWVEAPPPELAPKLSIDYQANESEPAPDFLFPLISLGSQAAMPPDYLMSAPASDEPSVLIGGSDASLNQAQPIFGDPSGGLETPLLIFPQPLGAELSPGEWPRLTPEEILMLPVQPRAGGIVVSGHLAPDNPREAFRIPVGPMTRSLSVSMSFNPDDPDGVSAASVSFFLATERGEILSQLPDVVKSFAGRPHELVVFLSNLSSDYQVVVQIAQPSTLLSGPPTTAPPESPIDTGTSYTMEIQRTEYDASKSNDSSILTDYSRVGSLSYSTTPNINTASVIGDGSSGSRLSLTLTEPSPDSRLRLASTPVDKAMTSQVEDAEYTIPGVSVGAPSRIGAGPVGPTLGVEPGDGVENPDLQDKALDLAINALGGGENLDVDLILAIGRTASDTGVARPGGQPRLQADLDGYLMTRGPGGLPVLTSAFNGGSEGIEASAMLATLEGDHLDGARKADSLSLDHLAKSPERPEERVTCADFIKAACGLAIGVGLTAGPLHPDLMAMLLSWIPRGLRRARAARGRSKRSARPRRTAPRFLS